MGHQAKISSFIASAVLVSKKLNHVSPNHPASLRLAGDPGFHPSKPNTGLPGTPVCARRGQRPSHAAVLIAAFLFRGR